jgi:tetratricopeptide (TPR) repeat protein
MQNSHFFILSNYSLLATLFGVAFLFILYYLKPVCKSKLINIVYWLLLTSCGIIILWLNSRLVWLALLITAGLIYGKQKQVTRKVQWLGIVAFLFTSYFLVVLHKKDSTLGRWLIYKINWQLLKDNWLWGTQEPYNIAFNHAQAAYFLQQPLQANIKEKLLAANGFFALNEWINLWIGYGIIGLVTCMLIVVLLLRLCLQQATLRGKHVTSVGIIEFLLVTSFGSYTFHVSLFLLIFFIATLQLTNRVYGYAPKNLLLFLMIVATIIGVYIETTSFLKQKQIQQVQDLIREGYFNEAKATAFKAINEGNETAVLDYAIAKVYYQIGQTDSALAFVIKAHKGICTDELHCFWGTILTEQKAHYQANEEFRLAMNIFPCKFKNRLLLIENFLVLGDTVQAKKLTAASVVFPEKIPSVSSHSYKEKIRAIATSLNINCP